MWVRHFMVTSVIYSKIQYSIRFKNLSYYRPVELNTIISTILINFECPSNIGRLLLRTFTFSNSQAAREFWKFWYVWNNFFSMGWIPLFVIMWKKTYRKQHKKRDWAFISIQPFIAYCNILITCVSINKNLWESWTSYFG